VSVFTTINVYLCDSLLVLADMSLYDFYHCCYHNYCIQLFITGHSLGAALATLCAARLQYDELPQRAQIPPVHAVYTYGSPRAGDMAFKDKYIQELDKITFR
jgi:predicted lipase